MLMYLHHSHGPFEWLAIAVFAVIALIGGIIQSRKARERSADLQGLAPRLGFDSFNPERNPDFAAAWGFLSRLSQGDNRYAFNIFEGTYQDQKMFLFDYHYGTGSGKNREEHYFTMFMLIIKEAFPKVTIGPENLFSKIEGVFDSTNIKFESAEFSRVYCVHSGDKKFAYDVCNPQMIEYLLANPGLEIEIQGPVIALVFKPQLPVGQYQLNLQRLGQIRALLPQYLFTSA
ncbi:MAG TPA: hypothetical protein VK811_02695 [Candidatus Acidoferrum sp.]|nr:hypothetical protein [Candidatus Acidoferrum sp.]